jgi:protein disulfide-isomerase
MSVARALPSTHVLTRSWSILLALVTSLVLGVSAHAAEGWLTKYDDAIAESKKSGRPILADFTGSDWCGWCIKLKQEVFDTKEFKEWAAQNVVLLELDFPRKKEQDPAIKAKNRELAQTHGVQGYPTILILNADGKKIGELGYMEGGPKTWIAEFVKQYKAAAPKK